MTTNKSQAWGFFDGTRQGPQDFSSGGGILYLSDSNYVKFKAHLGVESNNYAEALGL
jgi:hypothetical protein